MFDVIYNIYSQINTLPPIQALFLQLNCLETKDTRCLDSAVSKSGQYEVIKVGFIRRDEVCDGGIFDDIVLARIFVTRYRDIGKKPVMLRTSLVIFRIKRKKKNRLNTNYIYVKAGPNSKLEKFSQ